jgi:diketogulonate reductase-like aldo/keto reductase
MRTLPWGASGLEVSVIGQGTFNLEKGKQTAVEALHHGFELGMSHVDTAEMYASGRCESFLGEALAGKRDRAFLVSKVLPENASYDGTIAACEASLRRLRTDHLDGYLLHWWEGHHPMEETFRAFDKLLEDGKIRSWGVSNFTVPELEKALAITGPGKIACNQVEYHLKKLDIERDLIPFCREHGITVIAHSPFGDAKFPSTLSRQGLLLKRIEREYGPSPRRVALAFLLQREVAVIPKAGKASHLDDNAAALDVRLPPHVIAELERLFPL